MGFTRRVALLLHMLERGLIPCIEVFNEVLLLTLSLLNLELSVVNVLSVLVDQFGDFFLHLDDAATGLVRNLVHVHDVMTLFEVVSCTPIAEQLLVLNAQMCCISYLFLHSWGLLTSRLLLGHQATLILPFITRAAHHFAVCEQIRIKHAC